MKRFSFFHVKYISLAEQAAAPEQGAAASFYSTENERFCRGDGQRAAAKTVEEYLLSPNKKILSKSLASWTTRRTDGPWPWTTSFW